MKIKEKIAKLIDVKSIVTLALTAVFAVQTLRGIVSSEQFQTICDLTSRIQKRLKRLDLTGIEWICLKCAYIS